MAFASLQGLPLYCNCTMVGNPEVMRLFPLFVIEKVYTMIKNSRNRRRISLGLLAIGGVLFWLAPENAWISLIFAGFGVLLEVIGITLGHSEHA